MGRAHGRWRPAAALLRLRTRRHLRRHAHAMCSLRRRSQARRVRCSSRPSPLPAIPHLCGLPVPLARPFALALRCFLGYFAALRTDLSTHVLPLSALVLRARSSCCVSEAVSSRARTLARSTRPFRTDRSTCALRAGPGPSLAAALAPSAWFWTPAEARARVHAVERSDRLALQLAHPAVPCARHLCSRAR